MPFDPFDSDLRRQIARNKFLVETQVTRVDQGAKARSLLDAVFSELETIENGASSSISQVNPERATGIYVDLWADFFGASRKTAQTAFARASDLVVRFFVDSGTFGDLNGGVDIPISADSVVLFGNRKIFVDGTFEFGQVEYKLTDNVILAAGDSEQYVSVVAADTGEFYNIPKGALTVHNFTDYLTYPNRPLKIENTEPIVNGEDEEESDSLQSRYLRSSVSRGQTIESSIIQMAMGVPGVSRAFIVPFFSGPSTLDVFVDAESFLIPSSLIESVITRMAQISFPGIKTRVFPVDRVGVSVELDVRLRANLDQSEKEALQRNIEDTLVQNIVATPIGGIINLLDIHKYLSMTDPNIAEIGSFTRPFSSLYIYRDASGDRMAQIWDPNDDLVLSEYERLFLEDSLATPVQVNLTYKR